MPSKLLGLNIMVAADEVSELKRCLESCKGGLFDEIAILANYKDDPKEADNIIEVAKQYTELIKLEKWTNHFGDMRNKSFSISTTKYILWLDADDVLKPSEYQKILDFKPKLHNFDMVLIDYVYFHDDNDNPVVVLPRERIVKNCEEIKWHDPIHEYMNMDGGIKMHRLNAKVDHYRTKPFNPERNLKLLSEEYKKEGCSTRIKFYYGKELADLGRWEEAIPILEEYVKKGHGFCDNLTVACIKLARYYSHVKKLDEARAYSLKGIAFNPTYAEHYVCLGDIFYEKRDFETAVRYYKEALSKELTGGMSQIVDYYEFVPAYRLAVIYLACGKIEEAKDYIEVAFKCHPEDEKVIDIRGKIDRELKKVREGAVLKDSDQGGIEKFLKDRGYACEVLKNNNEYADLRLTKDRAPNIVYFIPGIAKEDPATRIRRLNIEGELSKRYKTKIIQDYYSNPVFNIRNLVEEANIAIFTQVLPKDYEIMSYLRSMGILTILDKCEAIFDGNSDKFMSEVDLIVCCSTKLENMVNDRGFGKTMVIRDATEPSSELKVVDSKPKEKLKALYMGMGGNSFLVTDVLRDEIEKAGYELVVITEWDNATKPWSLETWDKDMVECDVVLCPQRVDIQPAKSNVKVTQAMALGMPVVASRIKAYEEVINSGINGYICDGTHDWYRALVELADADTRTKVGQEALESVSAYSLEAITSEWENAFIKILKEGIKPKSVKEKFEVKHRKLVDLIITSYNNVEYLKLLINSILLNTTHPYNIIISDAGSDQETWEYLNTLKGMTVLGSQGNRKTFSEACNAGIRVSQTEFFVIMNSDLIVSKNWLTNLVDKMESVDRLSACGVLSNCDRGWLHDNPNDQLKPRYNMRLEKAGIELIPGMKYDTIKPNIDELYDFMDKSNHENKGKYVPQAWVAAYCTIFARSAVNQVGLFDPRYRNGCEDLDLCMRLSKFDFAIGQAIDSFVYHFGGISRGAYQNESKEAYDKEDIENHRMYKNKWSKERVVIWTGPAWEPWDKAKVDEGMAGSETWASYLAEEFVLKGYDVTVYNDLKIKNKKDTIYEPIVREGKRVGDVRYRDHTNLMGDVQYIYIDHFISSRSVEPIRHNVHGVRNYVMIHDIWLSSDPSYDIMSWRVDKYAYLSDWHKDFLIQHHRIPESKMFLTANGPVGNRENIDMSKKKNRTIYSSSPDRGLYQLLKQIFPRIREQVPDFELYIAYGFFNWESAAKMRNDVVSLRLIEKIKELIDQPGVTYLDRISKQELAEKQRDCKIWIFPTWFDETFCIGSEESGLCKSAILSTRKAGLITTVGDAGILLPPEGLTRDEEYPESYVSKCVEEAVKLLTDDEYRIMWAEKAYNKMKEYSWSNIADEWIRHFSSGDNK